MMTLWIFMWHLNDFAICFDHGMTPTQLPHNLKGFFLLSRRLWGGLCPPTTSGSICQTTKFYAKSSYWAMPMRLSSTRQPFSLYRTSTQRNSITYIIMYIPTFLILLLYYILQSHKTLLSDHSSMYYWDLPLFWFQCHCDTYWLK